MYSLQGHMEQVCLQIITKFLNKLKLHTQTAFLTTVKLEMNNKVNHPVTTASTIMLCLFGNYGIHILK